MFRRHIYSGSGMVRRRILRIIILSVSLMFLFLGGLVFIRRLPQAKDRKVAQTLWEKAQYRDTFEIGGQSLEEAPTDYDALILRGFSAYQLALAQVTEAEKFVYIDKCIQDLRKALVVRQDTKDDFIHYMLGKAYYSKGNNYADLAVKFLETARETTSRPELLPDLPEWLGLAYAALHDYENSASAFTKALSVSQPPSDLLLLAIAQSYMQFDSDLAISYLRLCVETSKDYKAILQAHLLLGRIYENKDLQAAIGEYTAILDDIGENAEAHYRLGEVYAMNNDNVHARAEWRKAIRVDPTHGPSRERLSLR